jgi:hypothetical protein
MDKLTLKFRVLRRKNARNNDCNFAAAAGYPEASRVATDTLRHFGDTLMHFLWRSRLTLGQSLPRMARKGR